MTWTVPVSLLVEATIFALLLRMSAQLGEQQLQEWQNCAITQTLYHASVSALTQLLKRVRECLWNTLSGNFSSNFWLTFTHRGIPRGAFLFWFLHLPLICYDIQGCAETARSPSLMLLGRKRAARGKGWVWTCWLRSALYFCFYLTLYFEAFLSMKILWFPPVLAAGQFQCNSLHFHRTWRPFFATFAFEGGQTRALVLETNMATEQWEYNSNENSYFSSLLLKCSAINCILHCYMYTCIYLLDYQFTWFLRKSCVVFFSLQQSQ